MIKARQSIEVVSPEPVGGRNLLRYSETVDKNRYSWLSPYPLTAGKNGDRDYLEMTVPADATSVSTIRGGADTTKVRTGKVLEPGIPYSYTLWIWCSKEAPFNNGSLGHIWTKESPDATDNHLENVISYSPAVIPANTWTRCEVLFTVSKQAFMIPFLYNVPKGSTFRFCNPQVEQGNTPTDWTPAPEDVEQGITDAITEISKKYDASLVVLSDSITGTVAEKETKLQNDIKTVTDTVSRLTQKADGIQADFTKLSNTVNENDQTTTGQINEIKKYIRFDADGITLGQSDNQLKVQITNERLSFLQGDIEVAYFSNNRMHITDADIDNSIRLGHFAFIPRDDGSLDFKKVA